MHTNVSSTLFLIQSRHLNEESKTHIHLLDKTETEMSAETLALRAEAVRAETMRKGQVREGGMSA